MPSIFGFHLQQQVTPYVILFIERDGSTYLTSLLISHPDINAIYERFAVMKQKGEGAQEQLDWARSFLTPPLIGKTAALGFKTKLVDVLDHAGFARLLQERWVHILQMQRRNHVKAVVSRINARRLHDASGNWNLYKEEDRMPPMAIDRAEFDAFLKERELAEQELEAYVSQLRLPTLKIVYEDLLRERDATMQRVFSFLRVQPLQVEGKTLKHTSDDLREVILNFDELRAQYVGTVYESMFDEVLASAVA
jgi:LPS sulfotransferase NodH